MIAPGTVLQNRYLVERQVGAGGMGAVYIATDQRFGSTVALKETFFEDPGMRRAFEREAKLLNHLRHTTLPRVSDHFGEGDGQFLVMEFIPGEDLSTMLKQRGTAFPVTDVLAWADQLLDALDYLHTQIPPVIHRDIKPQNLKLMPRNQIVLLDFGLAKGAPMQTRVTATGSVFGYSFNYAPIEQMQGTGTDPRSDLYSLGATLYHLLTYKPPSDALARATAVLNGEPDPLRPASEANGNVPAEVAEVLARAMRQSAAQRFASAPEMRDALRQAAQFVYGKDAATTATPALQTNTSQGKSAPFESETQIMDASATNRLPLAETEELLEETAVVGKQGDSTLTGAGSVEGAGSAQGAKPTHASDARAAAAGTFNQTLEDNSAVTRASAARVAPAARGSSRRTLGVIAGVVIVALISAVAYSFAHRAASSDSTAGQPTPQASATSQPSESPQMPATHDGNAPAETQDASEATPATHAAQPQHTPAATAKNSKTRNDNQPAPEQKPAPAQPAPPPQAASGDEAESPFRNRDMQDNPPSDEEINRWLALHPHWLENHPNRARMLRQRNVQQQRRRNNPPSRP